MNKQKKAIIGASLASLFLISSAFVYNKIYAQYSFIPFGGYINHVEYCCNGLMLTIGGPSGINWGNYYIPWSDVGNPEVVKAWYQIFREGPQVVGHASPGGVCDTVESECDAPIPTEGTIRLIGTTDD